MQRSLARPCIQPNKRFLKVPPFLFIIFKILFSSSLKRQKGLDSYIFVTLPSPRNRTQSLPPYTISTPTVMRQLSANEKKNPYRYFRTKNLNCLNYSCDYLNYYIFLITLCIGNVDLQEIVVNIQRRAFYPNHLHKTCIFLDQPYNFKVWLQYQIWQPSPTFSKNYIACYLVHKLRAYCLDYVIKIQSDYVNILV